MATVPPAMATFLQALYGADSQVVQSEDKFPVYSIPGKRISITTDEYRGCRIIVNKSEDKLTKQDKLVIKAALKQLVQTFINTPTCTYVAVDIHLPAQANIAGMLPKYFQVGNPDNSNLIHDDHGKVLTYWAWTDLKNKCPIPTLGPTHIYGASLTLIDRLFNKVFLVRSKARSDLFECPGGGDDPEKDMHLYDTAARETQEEAGLANMSISNVTIVGQMELPLRKFARGLHQFWACFADGMSEQQFSPQPSEILEADWFDIDVVLKAEAIRGFALSPDVIPSLQAALQGRGFQKYYEDKDGRRVFYMAITA